MRKTVFFLSVLLCGGAFAASGSNPDNECVPASRPSNECKVFFEKISPVRETLRAASSLVDIVPASVCELLLKQRRIRVSEYSDCFRILSSDVESYPFVDIGE